VARISDRKAVTEFRSHALHLIYKTTLCEHKV